MSAQRAVAYFVSVGWTPAQAAGIAANLQAESNFRPDAVGDGGRAYGIAQWHPPRQGDFARAMGKDIRGSSLDEQLAFVHWELTNTEKRAGEALRACITANEAGACVSRMYERPADANGEAVKRAALAAKIAADYAPPPTHLEREPRADAPAATQPALPPTPTKEPRMGALALFAPILAQLVPQIATILKPESDVAKRNVALAETLVKTITDAAAAPNLQAAVEKMQADPEVQTTVQRAVVTEPSIMAALQIGPGSFKEAAERSAAIVASADKWWKIVLNPVLLVTLMTLPLVYIIVIELVKFMAKVSADVIAQTIGTVIGLVLGGVMGFWMGQTYQQTRSRTDPTAAAAQPKE